MRQGWNMTGKGRIYHVIDPETSKQPVIAETKHLLMDGMKKRSNAELQKHVDKFVTAQVAKDVRRHLNGSSG